MPISPSWLSPRHPRNLNRSPSRKRCLPPRKTSLADVSAELAIHDTDTAATLAEKRRAFARLNHPDRVKPQFRHNATLRMTAANLLIDQAIRMLRTREHFR